MAMPQSGPDYGGKLRRVQRPALSRLNRQFNRVSLYDFHRGRSTNGDAVRIFCKSGEPAGLSRRERVQASPGVDYTVEMSQIVLVRYGAVPEVGRFAHDF